jgi:hypothetical protein
MIRNALVVMALLVWSSPLAAEDMFGLGSRNAALAGAVAADCRDGSAAWYNPAALGAMDKRGLSVSFVSMFPEVEATVHDFGSLGRVPGYQVSGDSGLLDAATREGISGLFGEAADLARFSGVGISFVIPIHVLFPDLPFGLTFGSTSLIPDGGTSLAHFSAQTVDQPFFPTWNTPFNQSRINFGLGAELWPEILFAGASISVHSKVQGGVTTLNPVATYDEDNPDHNPPTPSQAGTTQSLGVTAALTAGLLVRPADWGEFALVYHGVEETSIELDVEATMELDLGEPLRMEVPYVMSGTFAYRPHRITHALAFTPGNLVVTAELQYAFWKGFEDRLQILEMKVPAAALHDGDLLYLEDLGGDFRVASAGRPPVRLHNTLTPRLGIEYGFDFGLALRAGYSYRPAPLDESQQHVNALLDNSWHTVAAGAGIKLIRKQESNSELNLNLHFQGLILDPRYNQVGKAGDDGSSIAGGYVLTQGFMAGFGVELESRF